MNTTNDIEAAKTQIDQLRYNWTAQIELASGQRMVIWCGAWHMLRRFVVAVIWIASDYPKRDLRTNESCS